MGSQQPKMITRVSKVQIDLGTLKARIHLELVRERKNNEVIKGQKELVAKIKGKMRNKTEEILIAERVLSSLKYAHACNILIGYAAQIRSQAHFISQNMLNAEKMAPFLPMIYSLIYAADHMGMTSLTQFKVLMRALNDPVAVQKHVNPEIINALAPSPIPEELNTYMLELSERNQIPIEEINMVGHKFTKEWTDMPSFPSLTPSQPSNFDDLEKKLAEDIKNKFSNGVFGNSHGGGGNFGPYQNMGPSQFIDNRVNPNNQGPSNFPNPIGGNTPNNLGAPSNDPKNYLDKGPGNTINPNIIPGKLGPDFYIPPEIPAKQNPQNPVQASLTNINDINNYPDVDEKSPLFKQASGFNDPDFDQLCDRLKKGV